MPSQKLKAILRSKSPFSQEEIESMSELDGWKWVYQNKSTPKENQLEICFTGFSASEKMELEQLAKYAGMTVKDSVTKSLKYLCIGETPGPAKLEKAKFQQARILNREQFISLISDNDSLSNK